MLLTDSKGIACRIPASVLLVFRHLPKVPPVEFLVTAAATGCFIAQETCIRREFIVHFSPAVKLPYFIDTAEVSTSGFQAGRARTENIYVHGGAVVLKYEWFLLEYSIALQFLQRVWMVHTHHIRRTHLLEARATTFCMLAPSTSYMWVLNVVFATCHPSDSYSFDVASSCW